MCQRSILNLSRVYRNFLRLPSQCKIQLNKKVTKIIYTSQEQFFFLSIIFSQLKYTHTRKKFVHKQKVLPDKLRSRKFLNLKFCYVQTVQFFLLTQFLEQQFLETLQRLVETQIPGPALILLTTGSAAGLRICISNTLPSGPGPEGYCETHCSRKLTACQFR